MAGRSAADQNKLTLFLPQVVFLSGEINLQHPIAINAIIRSARRVIDSTNSVSLSFSLAKLMLSGQELYAMCQRAGAIKINNIVLLFVWLIALIARSPLSLLNATRSSSRVHLL
jgi:hypothetical protein